MEIGTAIFAMRRGDKVYRKAWRPGGSFLSLQVPDAHSKMTLPYIYISYPLGKSGDSFIKVPWTVSQIDLLATDWEVLG